MNLLIKSIRRLIGIKLSPNQMLLEISREYGFSMRVIRKSLIAVNEINLTKIVDAHNKTASEDKRISHSAMSRAIGGIKDGTPKVEISKQVLAKNLKLETDILFPLDEAA